MNNKYIIEVANWFMNIKAPALKDKIETGLKTIEEGMPLEGKMKRLFGFMLFSFAMNHGPASFIGIEFLAEDLFVLEEFKEYANDWIEHSKNKKEEVKP